MGVALKDLAGRIKRPVRSVSVCLDGELWARHDELTRRLDDLRAAAGTAKMGEPSGAREVAEQLQAIEAQMRASEVQLEFRGISTYELAAIQARFPTDPPGRGWDVTAGAHALIAACAVEPTTEDEARVFLEAVHQAVGDKVFGAAWLATTGSFDVPFSVRASALIRDTGSK